MEYGFGNVDGDDPLLCEWNEDENDVEEDDDDDDDDECDGAQGDKGEGDEGDAPEESVAAASKCSTARSDSGSSSSSSSSSALSEEGSNGTSTGGSRTGRDENDDEDEQVSSEQSAESSSAAGKSGNGSSSRDQPGSRGSSCKRKRSRSTSTGTGVGGPPMQVGGEEARKAGVHNSTRQRSLRRKRNSSKEHQDSGATAATAKHARRTDEKDIATSNSNYGGTGASENLSRREQSHGTSGSGDGNASTGNHPLFSLPSFTFSDMGGQVSQPQSTAASLHDLHANMEAALATFGAAALVGDQNSATNITIPGAGVDGIGNAKHEFMITSPSLASLLESASAAVNDGSSSTSLIQTMGTGTSSSLLAGPATVALGADVGGSIGNTNNSNNTTSPFLSVLPGWNANASAESQKHAEKQEAKASNEQSGRMSSNSCPSKATSKRKSTSASIRNTKPKIAIAPKHGQGGAQAQGQESVSSSSGTTSSGNAPAKVTESSSSAQDSSSSSSEGRHQKARPQPQQRQRQRQQQQQQQQQQLQQRQQQQNLQFHQHAHQAQAQQNQLHPLAMQSTATCPPIQPGLTAVGGAGSNGPILAYNAATGVLPAMPFHPAMQNAGMAPSATAQQLAAAAAVATQNVNPILALYQQQALAAVFAQQLQQQQHQQTKTQTSGGTDASAAIAPASRQDSVPPANKKVGRKAKKTSKRPSYAKKGVVKPSSVPSSSETTSSSSVSNVPSSSKASGDMSSSAANPPPFYLFEAPYELRMNYLQSQRLNDAAVATSSAASTVPTPTPALSPTDPNSYHYGMAVSGVSVNGFHPQLNAISNPIVPLAGAGQHHVGITAPRATTTALHPHQSGMSAPNPAVSGAPSQPVRLIDGRSSRPNVGPKPGVKERNEREQRRAQKIAELIEKLRLSMVRGGWKVEMKSKYHTLSTCADYVKHLIELTKEKETAVEKAKSDLAQREQERRDREKTKAGGDAASDQESETSSLTAFSSGEGAPQTTSASDDDDNDKAVGRKRRRKRSTATREGHEADNTDETEKAKSDKNRKGSSSGASPAKKKTRASKGGNKSSSVDDTLSSDESGPGGRNISLDKMSSSVSEMTDSNQSSMVATTPKNLACADDASGDRSSSSISSTAAVGPPRGGSREKPHRHADVVIKEKKPQRKGHKRKSVEEKTSLDEDFELDYEEVFLTSNVPQLIATPSGRVVNWNEFFLKATGLSGEEAKRLSIFSIVQADKLSTLFELVANALKSGASKARSPRDGSKSSSGASTADTKEGTSSTASSSSVQGKGNETSSDACARRKDKSAADSKTSSVDYSAVTLPCISFPSTYPKPPPNKKAKGNADVAVSIRQEKNSEKDKDKKNSEVNAKDTGKVKTDSMDLRIPLYMTVTLMSDDDPCKRCFHCVLTDTPATSSGALGSVTPELLAMLFTEVEEEEATSDEMCSSLINTNADSNDTGADSNISQSKKQKL